MNRTESVLKLPVITDRTRSTGSGRSRVSARACRQTTLSRPLCSTTFLVTSITGSGSTR